MEQGPSKSMSTVAIEDKEAGVCAWCGKENIFAPSTQHLTVHTTCLNCGSTGPIMGILHVRRRFLAYYKMKEAIANIAPWLSAALSDPTQKPCKKFEDACNAILELDKTYNRE